jgi:hypothetical protein
LTYSWQIERWSFDDERGLRVFREAMSQRRLEPHWEKHQAWNNYVGDTGVVYLPVGYSGMGYLLNQWMGIEGVSYARACPQSSRFAISIWCGNANKSG